MRLEAKEEASSFSEVTSLPAEDPVPIALCNGTALSSSLAFITLCLVIDSASPLQRDLRPVTTETVLWGKDNARPFQ